MYFYAYEVPEALEETDYLRYEFYPLSCSSRAENKDRILYGLAVVPLISEGLKMANSFSYEAGI